MVDKLQRIAQAIRFLRLPSIIIGLISLISIAVIVLASRSHEEDRFLIPSIVVLFWAFSTHSFITTFRSIPEKPSEPLGFFPRLLRNISRVLYWLMGLVFFGTTFAVVVVTYRLVSFWLSDYGW